MSRLPAPYQQRGALLQHLAGAGVELFTAEGEPKELAPRAELFPEEQACVERAVLRRREQYAATRHLAHGAFERLGGRRVPLVNRSDRSPIWPEGLVGSLTHTDTWCGVAVARRGSMLSLGVDAEQDSPLEPALQSRVLTEREQRQLSHYSDRQRAQLAKLYFSAKESFYKCQYPLTGQFLGFHDVELSIELQRGTFTAQAITRAGLLARPFHGSFVGSTDLWVTMVLLPESE